MSVAWAPPIHEEAGPVFEPGDVIVCAHFDDAVLCLGGALAAPGPRPRVVTVCAGVPGTGAGTGPDCSDWDHRSGFVSGAQAARARIEEDLAAAAALGFQARHLDFVDAPYAPDPWPLEALLDALREELADAATIYAPAGIGGHPDHVRTRDATLRVARDQAGPNVRLYADLPYAMVSPLWGTGRFHDEGAGHRALAPLADLRGTWRLAAPRYHRLTETEWTAKRAAVLAYASQMAPLEQDFPGFTADPGPLLTEAVWVATGPDR